MVRARKGGVIGREESGFQIVHEEGREMIRMWRDQRQRSIRKSRFPNFMVYSIRLETLRHFIRNFNFMVITQLVIAVLSVLIFQKAGVAFEIQLPLLVSPIVFPLAFSIVTDFQRREKVLEDMGVFKSSTMMWYFCMREWRKGAGMDTEWLDTVHGKLKSLLFHLHEYLVTYKPDNRRIILKVIYEDFSDTSQLIDGIRESKLPANTAIVSCAINLINMACMAFERLRVVREYRSPRSIRSFNKVFIMLAPIILAPHFIAQAKGVPWQPYYMTIIVTVIFAILQGVQDKLDDPFDGLGEDDINLDALDEWSSQCMKHTKNRQFDVNKFRKPNGVITLATDLDHMANGYVLDAKEKRHQDEDFVEKQLKVVANDTVSTCSNDSSRDNSNTTLEESGEPPLEVQKEELMHQKEDTRNEDIEVEKDVATPANFTDGEERKEELVDCSKKCPLESV